MKKILYILAFCIVSGSCGDFLSEYPKDLLYVNTIQDLDELIVGEGYMKTQQAETAEGITAIGGWIHVMDDDMVSLVHDKDPLPFEFFSEWRKDPFMKQNGGSGEDDNWKNLYRHIGALNVILNKLEDFKDAGPDYSRLKGEAYFLRAGFYFWLVNLYAKPYRVSTATSDPGVPLKLTDYVENTLYSRESVQKVYNAILSDLEKAATYLKGIRQPSVYRVNRMGVYAFMSRVYLYMENCEKAIAYSDSVLQSGNYHLLDLNQHDAKKKSVIYAGSPETIFSQGEYRVTMFSDRYINSYVASTGYLNAFTDKDHDLRYGSLRYFTHWKSRRTGYIIQKFRKYSEGGISDCFLLRLPEVYLNKAEALAILGREQEARDVLQSLREKRYTTGNVSEITGTGASLVKFVRNERRLELSFEGHRWFDLRRYAVSKYPETVKIQHPHWQANIGGATMGIEGYYILKPYTENADSYVMPIPSKELMINEGAMLENPRSNCEYVKL